MRKSLCFWMLTVLVLGFAACSSKDNDDRTVAEKAAGAYTGTIAVTQEDGTALGEPMPDQNIYITATGENQVTLELKNFQFMGIPVGDLKVPNVMVKEDGTVSGSASQVPIMGGQLMADLAVSGVVKDNAANLLIVVNAPLTAGGTPIVMNVTFVGNKK